MPQRNDFDSEMSDPLSGLLRMPSVSTCQASSARLAVVGTRFLRGDYVFALPPNSEIRNAIN